MAGGHGETLFDRLEAHGRTWKIYIMEPMPLSFTGVIHYPRLKDRLATHFVPFSEFERDAAEGTLPVSLIEPNMIAGHGDYHPAFGRSFSDTVDVALDNPSSMLSGEAFLERVYGAYRSATSADRTQHLEHAPADRMGRARWYVRPRPARPRAASRTLDAPAGELGFTFDRSGYRVPAILVSPWAESGAVHQRSTGTPR